MAHASGDTPLIDPEKPFKFPTENEQQSSQPSSPSFPNTRWMNVTTDFSRNPGIFDDVFKKIKGFNFFSFRFI
jgi:hypothetical protein